jgi:hypothetical protein
VRAADVPEWREVCLVIDLWGRTRDLVLKLDRPQGSSLLRDIAEAINGITATTTPSSHRSLTGYSETGRNIPSTELRGEAARRWLARRFATRGDEACKFRRSWPR